MGAREFEAFLTDLAVLGQVMPSTKNQELAALLFLYREVLVVELPWMTDICRARRTQRLPVVLTREEVNALLGELYGKRYQEKKHATIGPQTGYAPEYYPAGLCA